MGQDVKESCEVSSSSVPAKACPKVKKNVFGFLGARFKKIRLSSLAIVLLSIVLLASVVIDRDRKTVIEVLVDGEPVAQVSSANVADEALEKVLSHLSEITGQCVSFPLEISYEFRKNDGKDCIDASELAEIFSEYTKDVTTMAWGLYVDSELVAVLDNREDIVAVIEDVKEEHTALTNKEENIANDMDIRYQEYARESIIDAEELRSLFVFEAPEQEQERVTENVLLTSTELTTMSFNLYEQEIRDGIASNLEDKSEYIVLDFEVVYTKKLTEAVPFETTYEYNDDYYESQQYVKIKGRDGRAENTYEITTVKGEETSRKLVNQRILRSVRNEVIVVGTRPLPENMSPEEHGGRYMINPCPDSYISDYFGWRILRGRSDYHEGLDLAALGGTPIYAAASGEVIYKGYSYSYGYLVKVLHEDGLVTLYAHCSKLLADVGDTVVQGEKIAEVGATGNVTGYHLHFEVLDEGEKLDPESFIYSLD